LWPSLLGFSVCWASTNGPQQAASKSFGPGAPDIPWIGFGKIKDQNLEW